MGGKWVVVILAGLVGWSLYIASYRWWQIKFKTDQASHSTTIAITGLSGGLDVPRPVDEWPPLRAAWLVYQRFRELHPDIRLADRETLSLQGPAQESAVLMAMAGRTAGEVIAANCRVIDNWIEQDFLHPLDEYVLELVRQNLSDAAFVAKLPPDKQPPAMLSSLTIEQVQPEWVNIRPDVWQVIYRPGRDGVSHVWTWPYQTRTLALYYNRLIFADRAEHIRRAGLDPSRPPRTWEEVIEYSTAISDAETGTYGIILDLWGVDQSQGRGVSHLIDFLWQSGTEIIERDPKGGWKFVWDDSDGTIDTLRFLRELLFRKVRSGGNSSPIARTRSGTPWGGIEEFGSLTNAPAMCFSYSSSTMGVQALGNPETLGVGPLPAGPVLLREAMSPVPPKQSISWEEQKSLAIVSGNRVILDEMAGIEKQFAHPQKPGWFRFTGNRVGQWKSLVNFGDGWRIRAAQLDADMFGITRLAESKVARDAAWKYIHFLSTPEAQKIRTDLMVETGNAMFVAPNLLQTFGYDDLLENVPRPWREAYPSIVASGRPAPNGANCQHLHRVLSRMADSTLVITPPLQAQRLADDAEIQASWRSAANSGSSTVTNDGFQIAGWARESVDYANRRLLNLLPPDQVKKAHNYALVAVTLVAITFPTALWLFVRSNRRAMRNTASDFAPQRPRVHFQAWTFMAFAVATILIWQYFPLARGASMAFEDYRIMDSEGSATRWVGLDNFARVFTEPTSRRAAINTLLFVFLSLAAGFFTPIILAIMLDELPKGSLFFRMIYYLPAAMGGLVVAYLWAWFYSPQPTGLLNIAVRPIVVFLNNTSAWTQSHTALLWGLATLLVIGGALVLVRPLRKIGIAAMFLGTLAILGLCLAQVEPVSSPVNWLNSSALLAMICVILPGVWAGVGPGCIIYLAALKSIPDEVYEAADLDGAGPWRKIFNVTFPHLWPLIIIQFIGSFIGAFRSWESIFVMTGGGPKDGTLVIGMEIWYNAFAYLRFGYATALAWILGTILIGFTVFQLRVLRNARFSTAGRS